MSLSQPVVLTTNIMEARKCAVCGDMREVKNHYGVRSCYGCKAFFRKTINDKKEYHCFYGDNCVIEKETRNRCKSCRFKKCSSAGMDPNNLRDYNYNSKSKAVSDLPTFADLLEDGARLPAKDLKHAQTSPFNFDSSLAEQVDVKDFDRATNSIKLVQFLSKITKECINKQDPETAVDLEGIYGRNISLVDGLKDPGKVCPRTKWDFSASREAQIQDICFMWYRYFVPTADWVNCIPQFQELSENDQVHLFKLNSSNISVLFLVYLLLEHVGPELDVIPTGNGSYVRKDNNSGLLGPLLEYEMYLYKPALEIDVDATELSILAGIRMFQYHEKLSTEGQVIAKKFVDELYDALHEYQSFRFKDRTENERSRRHSKLLMLISRLTQVWSTEADVQIMLSTFKGMNIDGIPKELLFSSFDNKNK